MKYYLAIDIGASSGRHILSHLENGKIVLEEVHRFENGFSKKNGRFCWDTQKLFTEILNGMKKCKEIGKIPVSVGIDTWGVDFVLLDKYDNILGDAVSYRDSRTKGMDKELEKYISAEALYERTGIQKQMYNTIYQLLSVKMQEPENLEKAESLLLIPEYLTYLLSGKKLSEYTIATTGQLINIKTKSWDKELLDMLEIPTHIFCDMAMPGTVVGDVKPNIAKEIGYNIQVILPPCHDTASAVAAVPMKNDKALYISSGTWSLLGTETVIPVCDAAAMNANFTNEGGYEYRYRLLKNIMGLWMMQSVRREFDKKYSFPEIIEQAQKANIESVVDCQKDIFLAPESMIEAIKEECAITNQQIPQTVGEIAAVIYNSLAACYNNAIKELELITGNTYDAVNIVGGGCQDGYLNSLTAKITGKIVYAGPIEATALGNLAVQMISKGEFKDLAQARSVISDSFDIKIFQP